MPPMRKILVPTDLSPASVRVLDQAQEFAGKFSGTIDLLYVWSTPAVLAPEAVMTGVGVTEQPLMEWLGHSAREHLQRFESDARNAGVAIGRSYCELGDPATVIVEHAATGAYDLLVMGSHGRTGLSHVLMGSVAEKVVRRAACPVLTVRIGS